MTKPLFNQTKGVQKMGKKIIKHRVGGELKEYLAQAEYEREQDKAYAEVLRKRKCSPYCLNGNYK